MLGANECAAASRNRCMHLLIDVIRRSFPFYQRPHRSPATARREPCSLPCVLPLLGASANTSLEP